MSETSTCNSVDYGLCQSLNATQNIELKEIIGLSAFTVPDFALQMDG